MGNRRANRGFKQFPLIQSSLYCCQMVVQAPFKDLRSHKICVLISSGDGCKVGVLFSNGNWGQGLGGFFCNRKPCRGVPPHGGFCPFSLSDSLKGERTMALSPQLRRNLKTWKYQRLSGAIRAHRVHRNHFQRRQPQRTPRSHQIGPDRSAPGEPSLAEKTGESPAWDGSPEDHLAFAGGDAYSSRSSQTRCLH